MPSSVWRRLFRRRPRRPVWRGHFRPIVELLEGRLAPATYTWDGPANPPGGGPPDDNWSNANNWVPNGIPGAGDTVNFNPAVGTNTDSTMDLTNSTDGFSDGRVAELYIASTYTKTITLFKSLTVDVLDMRAGTIDGKDLRITQDAATVIHSTSSFEGGTIKAVTTVAGALAKLTLAGGTAKPDLEARLNIMPGAALEWRSGDMTVGGGVTIWVGGTFLADSEGTLGNGTTKWTLQSVGPSGAVSKGKGKLQNVDEQKVGSGKFFKSTSAINDGTPNIFYVIGDITDDGGGGSVEVQSGTLEVDGYYTQNSGTTTVDPGQTLAVSTDNGGTGTFTVSGGTVTDGGTGSTITAVSYQQSGGTTTLDGGSTLTAPTTTLSGGSLTISSATLSASSGFRIQSGGTLYGRGGTITGNVTNAGLLDLVIGTTVGTLTVQGNYTQTGTMNANLGGTNPVGYLSVTGTAYLGGTLNVLLQGGFMPNPPGQFTIVQGAIGSQFGSINLPTLTHGYWHVQWDPTDLILSISYMP